MKTSAEKSSTTTSATATHVANRPFFAKTGEVGFFMPQRSTVAPVVQMKMTVNKPGDMLEQEADKMADKVMRMPSPASIEKKLPEQTNEKLQKKEKEKEEKIQRAPISEEKVSKKEEEKIQKAAASEEKLQRDGGGAPSLTGNTQSAIQGKTTGGQPLSSDVRGYMEPRFNADFSNVRIHSDAESAGLSNQLSARAFTYQNHVFFSRDQYQPGTNEGKQLLAHELTHTIQQGHSIQRSPQVSTTTAAPPIQRFLGIDIPSWQDVIDWLAEKAYNIPGYRMFTIVIGVNPINGEAADRSAANILRAIVEFLPGGKIITDALEKYNVFEKAGSWVEGKLKRFSNLLGTIKSAIGKFIDDLDFLDIILHPVRTWERAVSIFTKPVNEIIDFIGSIFQEILQFIRDAVLMPLAALAKNTRGFDLLCALLGKNPITKEPVPRTPDTLIGGFMKLIGQEEIWENIKKGNAVQKAWQWFQNAMQGLFALVARFPEDFIAMLKSLEVMDFIILPNLFAKVIKVFGNFILNFYKWALNTVLDLLEIIFTVVAPKAVPYVAKAKSTFITIIKNPVGFVGNLVRAGKMGFEMFKERIGEHLKAALINWLVGPLAEAGVYIPKSFTLIEIVKLVLSVLGLTWQNIRSKLVKIIPEPVLVGLEKTAGILVTLVKDGPAAAWEQIKAELTDLKDQLIAQITQMVTTEIVKAAVTKLVTMLNPAGAVIQAIIAIYNTIFFFIQKINQIAAVVASFIDSISAIAAGQIANAAKKVEQTMANTLTVIIAFLAKFAGLGGIPDKIVGIVKKIRQPIDKGLDKIVAWLGNMLKKLVGAVKGAAGAIFQWWKKKMPIETGEEKHNLYFQGEEDSAELVVASSPRRLENFVTDARTNSEITGNPKKKASLDKITAEISVLRTIRNDLRPLKDAPEEKRKPHLDKLDISFGKIGTELGVVFADSKGGTKTNPIPIPWPKPAYTGYPKLSLYNQGSSDKPKWKLSAKKKTATLIATYNPDGSHSISAGPPVAPSELKSLGIKPPYQIKADMVIGPLTEASTPGGGTINSLLERYGWDAASEYMDGDHVVEIQFGGKDVQQNLWPLDASLNRGAGSRLSKQLVDLDGQKVTVDWLKKVKKKPGEETKKYFFKATGI
ncbi:MAG: DUF4157 domain-containing protein [Planctomycetia bacterium]|nr:MAG: DUF4157 domain-containing protein [Planctomycetia bacterium]TVL96163.1 MAG: hypothetical protein CV082_07935 [Candidatus Brocadia sp. BL1]HQU31013.1 DUF4157 domain-containing protein [Candidatus Brocadia sapporoensis]